jgi:CubicO group peptidase (beta-lactamase class C family)
MSEMIQPPPLPPQPRDTPWPTSAWPQGDIDAGVGQGAVTEAAEALFQPEATATCGRTDALVIVQGGRLALERYAPPFDAAATQPSWSMAKSLTQALVGLAVGDGRLDIRAPAAAPEWRGAGDPRAAITLDQLLRMSSGLAFIEDYTPGSTSDVIEMLYGAGKADTAAYAAGRPLIHPPGEAWSYASGTTNIVSRALGAALGLRGAGFEAFMRQRLFEPLGMTSPIPKFDAAGTFIGSSFCFCTPRDFARFGLLYLRNGIWDGRRLGGLCTRPDPPAARRPRRRLRSTLVAGRVRTGGVLGQRLRRPVHHPAAGPRPHRRAQRPDRGRGERGTEGAADRNRRPLRLDRPGFGGGERRAPGAGSLRQRILPAARGPS